jgi:tRNA pseudouridine38-40 synthase
VPTWKLTIEYDGTRYHGWQSQKNADRTVQGALIRAARELLGGVVSLGGAGRTDAGVHALAQVAHLKAAKALPTLEIERGLNDRLPFDIHVLSAEPAPPEFHARHDAGSRRYSYRISRRRTAFDKRLVWWIKDRLDVAAMREAAGLLPGRHDFASFCENAEGQESTVVEVSAASLSDADRDIVFSIEASHFLWKMVRRIVGTLVEVGRGRISVADFRRLIEHPKAGATAEWTAPPSGLFLESVRYDERSRTAREKTIPAPPPRRPRPSAPRRGAPVGNRPPPGKGPAPPPHGRSGGPGAGPARTSRPAGPAGNRPPYRGR